MVDSRDDRYNAITILFQAESTVVVAPYMNKLTKSEIHAIMTGGFATVAGSYMAVLIQVGVSTFTRFSIWLIKIDFKIYSTEIGKSIFSEKSKFIT